MTVSRLTVRLHRFELLAAVVSALVLAAAAVFIRIQLQSIDLPPSCLGNGALHGIPSASAACADRLTRFFEIDQRMAAPFFAVMLAFPILAGLFVGVPTVSREIERGTAALPWTLDGSRRRWLAVRLAVLLAILTASFIPLALASDWLEAARAPFVQPTGSFGDEGVRGIVLVARAIAGFVIGVMVGLVLGRQLPGLIVGILLGATVLLGATAALDAWSAAVAVVRPVDEARIGDRALATRLRATDGTLYTFSQVDAMQPPRPDLPPDTVDEQWVQAHFEEVALLVPGDRYPQAVLLQLALLIGGSALVAGSCFAGIERRRPA
jgi:hypothetical protein